MKSEFLMLGHTFKPGKHGIAGWYISEKLDGRRAYWDGGLSRGLWVSEVPYANRVKDDRLSEEPKATGLWSRAGKVIRAPEWWLDKLPFIPLDGELWLGRGRFQELSSIVSSFDSGEEWEDVEYRVFDSPPYLKMLADRRIKVRDYEFEIQDAMIWYYTRSDDLDFIIQSASVKWDFEFVSKWLKKRIVGTTKVSFLEQEQLPFDQQEAIKRIDSKLMELLNKGAEGIVLRKPVSFWVPQRSHCLLKYKPWKDDEAVITGFTTGRRTDKGSKWLGKIGALVVDYQGKRLELSGLTDAEREFKTESMEDWAKEFPGEDVPSQDHFEGVYFKIGDIVTFKFRELSDDNIPKEARYYRRRNE